MEIVMNNLFYPADILIPKNADMTKWSVVACDQYTSEPEYWKETEKLVGTEPSALRVVYPEIYLSEDREKRISEINKKMTEYTEAGIFAEYKNAFVYVRRTLKNGKVRKGIIGAVDLEDYDYVKGSQSFIRATEGTVIERIPPRVKIRENATLEFPHIMLLADDEKMKVIEPLDEKASTYEKLYDFPLMQNGGHIEGYLLPRECAEKLTEEINKLACAEEFEKKYGAGKRSPLVFAVGDGNHSLATAKTCWENIKKDLTEEERQTHPARFALVELVNLHDESLEFEPIHRVMFGIEPEKVYKAIFEFYPQASEEDNGGKKLILKYGADTKTVWIKDKKNNIAVGTLQDFIDWYLSENEGSVDYIHGADVTERLSKEKNNIGFILPAMKKSELFETVVLNGVLPRKTFSMGEAYDKRYYLEGKKIRK